MSALILEDYLKPCFKNGLSSRACGIIMRGTVIVVICFSVASVYVVQNLGPVLQLSMSVPATFVGSLFGVFIIGMFMPWIGKHAAFFGALIASTIMIYLVVIAQLDMAAGLVKFDTKVTSVEGCNYNFTMIEQPAMSITLKDFHEEAHHVSYLYYLPIGVIITCTLAFLLSFLFGFNDPRSVEIELLAPCMRQFFKQKVSLDIVVGPDASHLTLLKLK